MKKKSLLILVLTILISGLASIQAQTKNSGAGFAYQAVLRDVNGDVLDNKNVKLTLSLYLDESTSSPTWTQTKDLKTDKFGVVKTIVGKTDDDKAVASNFQDVNFNSAHFWFKVELQIGDEVKREISFAQLPSAPYSESAFSVTFSVPVGTIVPFAGQVKDIPEGWLLCDGKSFDGGDSKYSQLKDILGSLYSGGMSLPTNHFRVPDFRGTFLRGADNRAANAQGFDPDRPREVGSLQQYAVDVKDFNGTLNALTYKPWFNNQIIADGTVFKATTGYTQGFQYEGNRVSVQAATYTLTPPEKYTKETRPVNHAVNYIIKY